MGQIAKKIKNKKYSQPSDNHIVLEVIKVSDKSIIFTKLDFAA